MNISENEGRWPPVYDFTQLGQQIKDLIADGSLFDQFFVFNCDRTEFFQGDIVSLKSTPAYIDKDGDIAIIDEDFRYWVILGNTCDLSRSPENDYCVAVPHLTHITPLMPIPDNIPGTVLENLKKYKLYKRIFIPGWDGEQNDFFMDLTVMSSIEKQCLTDHAQVLARLNFKTWLLLHSCLVRYLARDDGRHD